MLVQNVSFLHPPSSARLSPVQRRVWVRVQHGNKCHLAEKEEKKEKRDGGRNGKREKERERDEEEVAAPRAGCGQIMGRFSSCIIWSHCMVLRSVDALIFLSFLGFRRPALHCGQILILAPLGCTMVAEREPTSGNAGASVGRPTHTPIHSFIHSFPLSSPFLPGTAACARSRSRCWSAACSWRTRGRSAPRLCCRSASTSEPKRKRSWRRPTTEDEGGEERNISSKRGRGGDDRGGGGGGDGLENLEPVNLKSTPSPSSTPLSFFLQQQ